MKEKLIEFETALLLRDKNFENWDNNITFPKNKTEYKKSNIAVTQDVIKNWLREKHNIFIDIIPFYNEEDLPLTKTNRPKPKGYFVWDYYDEDFSEQEVGKFNNYEDALEEGLINGLKLI